MTTLSEFRALRTHVTDINDHLCTGEGTPISGYVYGDLGYIEDTDNGEYYVIAERSEYITASLNDAESWLFNNWVRYL